jgi:hypothetical protein
MKFILLALAASTCAPVASIGLRSLRNRSPDKSNEGSEASAAVAVAVVGERELLSTWCDPNTPAKWHPNYAGAGSIVRCTFKADCDSTGYDTKLACCNGAYGGQVPVSCKAGFANPSTTFSFDEEGKKPEAPLFLEEELNGVGITPWPPATSPRR